MKARLRVGVLAMLSALYVYAPSRAQAAVPCSTCVVTAIACLGVCYSNPSLTGWQLTACIGACGAGEYACLSNCE